MTGIDTPDYQRGVVSAQKLLATVPAATISELVGIPPNAETLVVVLQPGDAVRQVTATGSTSGVQYPVMAARTTTQLVVSNAFFVDVSNPVDAQVQILLSGSPANSWFIYSDAGAHITADVSNSRDVSGRLLTVPTIPYPQPGSHPPIELRYFSAGPVASGALLAAPGAGVRYRLFSAAMAAVAAGLFGIVSDAVAGIGLLGCVGVGNQSSSFPPQGVALAENSAINYTLNAGAGTMGIWLTYTTEVI